jgi:hypothetical protein
MRECLKLLCLFFIYNLILCNGNENLQRDRINSLHFLRNDCEEYNSCVRSCSKRNTRTTEHPSQIAYDIKSQNRLLEYSILNECEKECSFYMCDDE